MFISGYIPAEFTGTYLGCYKDRAEDSGGRALSRSYYHRNKGNSIKRCLDFCGLAGDMQLLLFNKV